MHWQEHSADPDPAPTSPADKPATPPGSGWLDRRKLLHRLLEPAPQPTPPQTPKAQGAGKTSQ